MSGSNLPPGVTTSMIPGNRPEDITFDKALERVSEVLDELYSEIPEDFILEEIVAEWLADRIRQQIELKRKRYYDDVYDRLRGEMPEEIGDDLERFLEIVATAYSQHRLQRAVERANVISNL